VELVRAATWRHAAWCVARLRHTDVVVVHTTASLVAAAVGLLGRTTPLVAVRHFSWRRWSDADGQGSRIARLCRPTSGPATSSPTASGPATSSLTASSPAAPGLLRAAVQRWVNGRVDVQVAVSRTVAAGIDGPAVVIHSGVQARPDRTPAAARPNRVVVLQRLEPSKATDVAMHAWALSGLRHQGWVLDVVGDGSCRDALVAQAAQLQLGESVVLHGHVADVAPMLDRAALLLAPCPDEPFGLSVVEAMAAGVPVVAAGGGGHIETLGAVEGAGLFTPGDPVAAAAVLDRLGPDTQARQALADRQAAVQQQWFDLGVQVGAMERLLGSLVGERFATHRARA
jgi:glycosyltransferase involved in cell wall biosynthesis